MRSRFGALVALLAISACAGKAVQSSEGEASTSAACDRFVRAKAAAGGMQAAAPNAYLVQRERALCEEALRFSTIDAGAFDACSAALQQLPPGSYGPPAACRFTAPGMLPEGAACLMAYQCATGQCVKKYGGNNEYWPRDNLYFNPGPHGCGRCAGTGVLGEPCGFDAGKVCEAGLGCTDTEQVCVALAELGQACGPPGQTDAQHPGCGPQSVCLQGACVAFSSIPEGGPCFDYGMDLRIVCAQGLTCNEAGACAPHAASMGDAGDGAPCEHNASCAEPGLCDLDGHCGSMARRAMPGESCASPLNPCWLGNCHSSDRELPATCPQILSDGATCDSIDATRACDAYAHCVDGTCRMLTLELCE